MSEGATDAAGHERQDTPSPRPRVPPSFLVLARGCFPPERVEVWWDERPRPTTPELEASIEAAWQAAVRRAQRCGLELYPGPLCRLVDHRVEGERLLLTLGPTDFRALVGTNWAQPHRYHELGPERFANAVGVSATLRTADGRLLVVRRGRTVFHHPGWYHVPSGHLEPEAHGADPFRAIQAELREEAGVEARELERLVCRGLALVADTCKPELVFEAHTSLPAGALLARFQPGENQALVALADRGPTLRRFLTRHRRVTPAARACLHLFGAAAYGEGWTGYE
ncbi:MAG: NUDIX hydrolase [Chloroflexi bacterium]|nr:NUDIX hydrolase [Chloroflexota bacterium]